MIIPKIVIIRTTKGQKYADFIVKEINLAGYHAGVVDLKNIGEYLKGNNCSPEKTLIHTRTASPNYTYRILKKLENQGYRIINSSEVIKLTSDKYQSCVFAQKNNIPCAETIKVSKKEVFSLIGEKVKKWGKVVVKPIVSQGQGKFAFMFGKDNLAEIEKIKDIPVEEVVLQEYIDYQRLTRIVIIGFKAVKEAVFYDEPGNNWKCSVCLNPEIKLHQNSPRELLELAEDISRKIKSEISFIDIFTTKNGYVLNEINTACNLVIHERISRHNISKKIAGYLIKKSKEL